MAAQANNGWTWSAEHSDWYCAELLPNGDWNYIFSKNTSSQSIPRNLRGGPDEEAEETEQPLEPGGRYNSEVPAPGAVDDVVTGIAGLSVAGHGRYPPRRSSQGTRSRNSEVVASSSGHRQNYQVRRPSWSTAGRNDLPLQQQASQLQYPTQTIPQQNTAQPNFAYSTTPANWPSAPGYMAQSAGVSGNQMGTQAIQGYAGYLATSQYLQPHAEGSRPAPSEPDEVLTADDGSIKMLRGTEGTSELLDPAFKVVVDHWKFFVPGRVFATLWWEPMGDQGRQQGPSLVKYGERAYAKIRRFIVVRAKPKDYYSYCIPISTHGGRGATRKGLNQSAHTIVYTGVTPPKKLEGETKLRKEPIQVRPVDPSEKLDPLSRVNLAKTYPVEHNVKVKEIGKVSESHLKKLIGYWKDLQA